MNMNVEDNSIDVVLENNIMNVEVQTEPVNIEVESNKADIIVEEENIDIEVDTPRVCDIENDHNKLINRELEDQHPIKSITGLEEALNNAGSIKDVKVNGESVVDEEGNANIEISDEIPETLYALGADYAEYFEWEDGNPNNEDRTSLFVSIVDGTRKIRKAMIGDDILGITSIDASVIGNAKYKDDKTYSAVGMTGVMKVKDNGECQIGDYVIPGDNGIAIPSTNEAGYKVTARYSEDLIEVLMAHDAEMISRIKDEINKKVDKNDVYTKEEVGQLADSIDERMSNLEEVGGQLIKQVGNKADKSEIPSLSGYATEQWVKSQEYMPVPDFHEYIEFFYYNKAQTDEKFEDYYNKEEVDTKLENLPTGGGSTLTGGDNTVIEENKINVYTNTGYKVIEKDIRLQPILAISNSNQNRMVYTLDEIIIIYDGTNEIRRSENGIDFERIRIPCRCAYLAYNESNKILYGTDNVSNFFYSDDNGLTWTLLPNNRASNVTSIDIGYGAGFRATYRSTKEIINWSFQNNALSQNTKITSTIYPDFTAMANSTQYIWCNSSGTFKYGAGSKEGDFHSVSGVTVNMLKRVNDITFMGLRNSNKMYYLRPGAGSITAYRWIAYDLPETCTLNDIIYNPYDETYYLYTNINTYYKTKDFVEYESVDKDGLRGTQGYFTLMGIQSVCSEKNKLLLAPTRTTLENKAQEWDRILDKSRWVGDGLELDGEQIKAKVTNPLRVSMYGIGLGVVEDYNLPDYVIEGVYVAMGEEKGLFDPYEIENWFWTEDAYPVDDMYKAVKFIFSQEGSFYNQITWEEEYYVEQYEYGYLYYDQNMNIFKYKKLGNLSWMFE